MGMKQILLYVLTHVMKCLQSLAGVQHSEDEPQKRLRELTGGERPL